MSLANTLPLLLGLAWLLPLASFTLIVFFGPRMGRPAGAGYLATRRDHFCVRLSLIALVTWMWNYPTVAVHHGSEEATESRLGRFRRLASRVGFAFRESCQSRGGHMAADATGAASTELPSL